MLWYILLIDWPIHVQVNYYLWEPISLKVVLNDITFGYVQHFVTFDWNRLKFWMWTSTHWCHKKMMLESRYLKTIIAPICNVREAISKFILLIGLITNCTHRNNESQGCAWYNANVWQIDYESVILHHTHPWCLLGSKLIIHFSWLYSTDPDDKQYWHMIGIIFLVLPFQ